MSFGKFLKTTREQKKISKYRLGQDTEIRVTTITKYENEAIQPTIKKADKLCRALGVQYIIGERRKRK